MMARKKKTDSERPKEDVQTERLMKLTDSTPIAGIPGPGRWLVAQYMPTALFSLKISLATSSVGKTIIIPTPYAIKMAFVDAAFRARFSYTDCADFLSSLVGLEVRIAVPDGAIVTHTFIKIRQEPHGGSKAGQPYISSIAYREVVQHHGSWRWAFDLTAGDDTLAERLVRIAPHVAYIGKRGSFIQFVGLSRRVDLGPEFTQPVQNQASWTAPDRAHIVPLDDFGPEADLETLSSFTANSPKRDRHRKFVETIIPLGMVNTGPGFSEYRKG